MGWGTRSAGILLGCLLAPLAQAQVDLEPFLKQDVLETLKISPTGEYYALTVPLEDQTILAVQRRSDRQITAKISAGADSIIDDVWWVSDDRVVVSVAKKYGSRDQPYATGELYATNVDGSVRRQIFGRYGLDGNDPLPRAAELVDPMPDDPRKVLISMYALDTSMPNTRLMTLDAYNGKLDTVATAPIRRADFVVDATGQVRFALGAGEDNASKLYHRATSDAPWTLINDENTTQRVEVPRGFAPDGPIVSREDVFPTRTPLSDAVSADLKKRGMKFVGSVTIYSYLQSIGIVNDHEQKCFVMGQLVAP